MPAAIYTLGQSVVITATFTVSGVPMNPGAVTGQVRNPDGTLSTVVLTSPSTGVWRGTFDPTQSGDHWFRITGTSPAKGAEEAMFRVRPKKVV
jgi:hypothetical protein